MTNAFGIVRRSICRACLLGAATLPVSETYGHAIVGLSAPPSGDSASRLLLSILPWLGIFVIVVIVGWFAIVWVRRLMRGDPKRDAGFALEDLRQMHRRGEIDDEEFARAKASLVGRTRHANREARSSGGWEESGRRGRAPKTPDEKDG